MRWRWIVLFLIAGLSMMEGSDPGWTSTAVVVGTERRQAAENVADEVKKLLAVKGGKGSSAVRVVLERVSGIWLVKVGPLKSTNGRPDPLLTTLAEHYPHLLLLSEGASLREVTKVSEPGIREERGYLSHLYLFGRMIRWEWLVLVLMTVIGGIWLYLRARRLKRMEDEQKRLEYRQKSIQARLKVES